jgi:hypothetical protein
MTDYSVDIPIQVNVVPDDIAQGRTINPVIRAERMVLLAQSEKVLATKELQRGKSQDAAQRLKNAASKLRQEASDISTSNEQSSESIRIIETEATEMERLAQFAEQEEAQYAIKRNYESFSQNTRSRKFRDDPNSTNKGEGETPK